MEDGGQIIGSVSVLWPNERFCPIKKVQDMSVDREANKKLRVREDKPSEDRFRVGEQNC